VGRELPGRREDERESERRIGKRVKGKEWLRGEWEM